MGGLFLRPNFGMYRRLILLRLRAYALATGRVLVRHWQMFVIAGVLVPIGTPVDKLVLALAYPLMAALQVGHDAFWHLWRIALIQAVALAWVAVQRRHITGGEFMAYARALPISLSLRRRVNLTVLLPANSLLLVPVAALLLIAPTGLFGATNIPFLVATACVLAGLVLLAQLAALERHVAAGLAIGLADAVLGWSLGRPVDAASWLALGGALVIGMFFFLRGRPFRTISLASTRRRPAGRAHRPGLRLLQWLPPAWRIQAQALWVQHPGSTALRGAIVFTLALGADGLMQVFAFDSRALPTAILAMATIALITSGLYRILQAAHRSARPYLDALPLRRHFWSIQDTAFVGMFGAAPLVVLLIPLFIHLESAVTSVLALALSYFTLLGLLRLPLVYGGRQAILLGVILASTWSGAAMAAVVR
ncbi:hypothetical protein GALL_421170 [mine drainage metagenome]|uniref:Uncharacterized protein n=1 Tax=mine drainage metagenome TaxID=410659 RepID=A0A1J5Q8J9_9ZZZZ